MNTRMRFPERTMILHGTQGSGKTTVAASYVAALSHKRVRPDDPASVLIVCSTFDECRHIGEILEEFNADMDNVAISTLRSANYPPYENLHTIVVFADAVHEGEKILAFLHGFDEAFSNLVHKVSLMSRRPHILVTVNS